MAISARVIEGLFVHRDAIERHLSAPMLKEREAYLAQLLAGGHKRDFVAERASTLCNVVRILGSSAVLINEEAILSAAATWIGEPRITIASLRVSRSFVTVSRSWFRFLGLYLPDARPSCHFDNAVAEFVKAMQNDLGYLPSTIASCSSSVKCFLVWASSHHDNLDSILLTDTDNFVAERRAAGQSERTIIGHCRSLRTFFRYAEGRGWSHNALSRTIRGPSSRRRFEVVRCPTWKQVRRLLASLDPSSPSHCRARAILLLASVYGLRRSEIVRMTLDDLDWRNEVLTVRRSKRGRIQQFPIQFEVGEAIIRYLRHVRPSCRYRNLFLTLHTPIRPAANLGQAMRKILTAPAIFDRPWGLHALRHACATELLRTGTSLSGIADFLGHRSVESVSVYAHCDLRSLRKVADLALESVL
jgi:integrase/recombinase XerD